MAVTFRAGANNSGTSTAPSVVVPAACQNGDVVLVQFSQNNTDVQTAAPAGLTQLDLNTTSAPFPNRFLYGIVGQNGLTAGATLSWTLSASRQWAIGLYSAAGVDNTTPIQGTLQVAATAATQSTMTAPPITTTATAWLVEAMSGKSNGTTITSWTVSAGATIRVTAAASNTFGGSTVFADIDANPLATGTYGGDTYTPSTASGASVRYIIALNPASGALTKAATTTALTTSSTATGTLGVNGSTSLAVTTASSASGVTGTSKGATSPTATATATASGSTGLSAGGTGTAVTVTISASGGLGSAGSTSLAVAFASTASGAVSGAYAGSALLALAVSPTASGVVSLPSSRPYLYVPPTWRTVAPLTSGGVLRVSFETSTCVYRRGGVWTNVMVAGQQDVSDLDVWVNPNDLSDTLLLFFTRPTPVPAEIALQLETVGSADPSWVDPQLIAIDSSGSLPSAGGGTPVPPAITPDPTPTPTDPALVYTPSSDGTTFTASGTGVIDNGDGTFSAPGIDNGDGTWSPA